MSTGGYRYGAPAGTEAEVAVVRAIYDAFAARDVEAVLPLVAEDFELLPSGTAGRVGRTEPYRGPAGLREYLTDVERVWHDLTLVADDIRAVAGSVVVFGHVSGRPRGSEELVERRVLWTWRLVDGKAVSLGVNDFGA
jgi:ketosteroid isomerase-like protein